MILFNEKHPHFTFWAGFIICGAKFIPNRIWEQNQGDAEKMKETHCGITYPSPPLVNAWARILDEVPDNRGRKGLASLSHDLTNLPIEWVREWTAYATKLFACLVVVGWPLLFTLGYLLGSL